MTTERGARGPSRRSVSQRLLVFLTKNATVNVLALLWIAAWSVIGPYREWQKDREEARRLGLLDPPRVSVGFSGEECVIANLDRRPVAEATITWDVYWVNATSCHIGAHLSGSAERSPAKAERSLLPRDLLRATFDRAEACKASPVACPAGSDCRLVVKCRARYHRLEDLEGYEQNVHALSGPNCGALKPVSTTYTYDNGQDGSIRIGWKDPAEQRALECFLSKRAEHEATFAKMRAFGDRAEALEPLK